MSSNPVILITGANTGLGFETVRSLCQSPKAYTIIIGGRSIDKANAAAKKAQTEFPESPSVLKTVQVDIEDDKSITQAFEYVSTEYGRVDVLVNNAGGLFDRQLASGNMTMRELWDKSWSVNTTGTQIFTHTFVPLLLKSSDPRLLFIASGTSTLEGSEDTVLPMNISPPKGWPKEPSSFGFGAYRSSKSGMNMMMREWTRILKEDGVKVWAISPGFLATGLGGNPDMNKKMGAEDPTLGAKFVRDVIEGARDDQVGKVVRRAVSNDPLLAHNRPMIAIRMASKIVDMSNFTSKFRAQKIGSHESTTRVTKRPRLVCNQCQKSKLRCDRGQPCGSCIKKDEAAACTYQRPTGTRTDINHNVMAEDKLLHLESLVKQLMQNQALPLSGNDTISTNTASPHERISGLTETVDGPRGEQLESARYIGSTHWSAILEDIHELKVTLGGRLDVDKYTGTSIYQSPAPSGELIFGSSNDFSLQHILSEYLPPKVEADRLLSTYFQGETYIIPFLHTYHFQRQYRKFWDGPTSVNPLWLSILFSVCYIASLIRGATTNSPHRSDNNLILGHSIFLTAAGKCLVLGEYHRPQQFTVEALALYAHCKNMRSLDPSRETGAILGMVVRMAYEMGYHRDPDYFGSFTVFEGEMRRRFWAACKQMDLMISFQLGLPSNIVIDHCDTRSPRNLLDSDFDEESETLPASRSEEATKLLWFIVKERQIPSFSKVCKNALSFNKMSEAEIMQLDNEIWEMYATIPDVLRTRPISDSIADPPFLIMTRLYIDFIHLKSLCVLHREYMARGNAFSTKSCVDAGEKLVSQFIDMYKEFSIGGQLYAERWMLTNFTMHDFLLGVMVLCLVLHTRWKRDAQSSEIDIATESRILTLLEQSHTICVEKSKESRDTLRVSHAVRLTLNRAKTPNAPRDNASEAPRADTIAASNFPTSVSDTPQLHPEHDSSSPWNGYIHSDESNFGMLDPFNFISNVDNMDWSVFDPPI
ncbi:hypothetical protein G7Y89_g4612 [Cudoniella acicularis]|uniref:Zn(2)-C6 fungal-type domain-containing protein n=1 Tax=Cudoniella acicularis TaxID=354080 RepID=A0A8H4W4J1_9HELO|nr:hypothetical protein G7Y89_g4612 [Cudoniella acicularis]